MPGVSFTQQPMSASPGTRRFWESTRGQIVALLRRASRTVNELAEALDLTDNAVRAHLATLERDGVIQTVGTRRGAAHKPNQAYDLTPDAAEQLFTKAYAPVLQTLLKALGERLPSAERDALLCDVGHRLAEEHLPQFAEMAQEERRERALALLAALGGQAELRQEGETLLIAGRDCPFSAVVAAGHPEVCLVAETLLSDLLHVPVTECCQKTAHPPRCCFAVAPAGSS